MAALSWRSKVPGAEKVSALVRPGRNIVVFDTETTGLSSKTAKIIQFSGLRFSIGKDLMLTENGKMDIYINPEEPITAKITEITGITDDTVKYAQPMRVQFAGIKRFLESADVWVGQNIPFDIRMVNAESERLNAHIANRPLIDTLDMSRDWLRKGTDVENYKLATVFSYLFPDAEMRFHDSMEDVKATSQIFEYFIHKYMDLIHDPRSFQEAKDTVPMSVNRASVFINPHNPKQQRIIIQLSDGDPGDIYYDIIDKQWACKTSTAAKRLFKRADMDDIEKQVLAKYRYRNMDELASNWLKYKRAQNKNKKSGNE